MLQDFAVGFAEQIKEYVNGMKLGDISVLPIIEQRNTCEFANDLNYAEVWITDDAVALLASSANAEFEGQKINMLLVVPSIDSSLYINRDSMAADFFFMLEKGVIKPIHLSSPLPLDGVNIYKSDIEKSVPKDLQISGPYLREVLGSKLRTKEVLLRKGLDVPKYLTLEGIPPSKYGALIEDFLNRYGLTHFVVKPDDGYQGHGIRLFHKESIEHCLEHIAELSKNGKKRIYIDERVFPKRWELDGKLQDWNIRAFIALNGAPEWIDAIVRHSDLMDDPTSQKPVNISQGSKYSTLEDVAIQTNLSIDEIIAKSIEISRAIQEDLIANNEAPRGFIGLDLIINSKTNTIEGNDSQCGGFYELAQLRGEPLQSVSQILLPRLGHFLKKNHKSAGSTTYVSCHKATEGEYLNGAAILMDRGNIKGAFELYKEAIRRGLATSETYTCMAILLATRGRKKSALSAAEKAYEMDPKGMFVVKHLLVINYGIENFKRAIELSTELGPLDKWNTEGYLCTAMAYARLGKREEARRVYRQILDFDPTHKMANYNLGKLYTHDKDCIK